MISVNNHSYFPVKHLPRYFTRFGARFVFDSQAPQYAHINPDERTGKIDAEIYLTIQRELKTTQKPVGVWIRNNDTATNNAPVVLTGQDLVDEINRVTESGVSSDPNRAQLQAVGISVGEPGSIELIDIYDARPVGQIPYLTEKGKQTAEYIRANVAGLENLSVELFLGGKHTPYATIAQLLNEVV